MTNKTKLYADGIFVSDCEVLLHDVKMMQEAKKNLSEEQFDGLFKQLCDKVREAIGIDNVIGLVLNDEETLVGIPFFSINATDKNNYTLCYDAEKQEFYMELEQHPSLEIIDLEIAEVKEEIEFALDFDEAKDAVEKLNGLYELRESTVACIKSMEKLEKVAKLMLAMPFIACANVLK
ncbi:hypothetical protein ACT7DP_30720 [Bacillus paranthracis]